MRIDYYSEKCYKWVAYSSQHYIRWFERKILCEWKLFNWPFLCGWILRMGFPCYILLSPISTFPAGVNIARNIEYKDHYTKSSFFLVTILPIDFQGFFFHFFRFHLEFVSFVSFCLFFSQYIRCDYLQQLHRRTNGILSRSISTGRKKVWFVNKCKRL